MSSKLDVHKDRIEEWCRAGVSYRRMAHALGVNKDTIIQFVGKELPSLATSKAAEGPVPAVLDQTALVSDYDVLKVKYDTLRAASVTQRNHDVQDEMLLREFADTVVPAEVIFHSPEAAEGGGHNHMHVLLLSDWHIGEVVDKEAMNGINEYDWEIAKERLNDVYKALVSFQNNRPYPIDELVIALLGDMNGGGNHEELSETNEFPAAEQCIRTGQLIGQFIEKVVADYPKIRVIGVAGNHPRVAKKPANKRVYDNFDWLSYKYAELYLKNYDLEWQLPRSGYHIAEVAGKQMLFFHGDGIRSTMPGVPWGGVVRRVNEMKKQYAEQGVLLSYFALGHFHQANVTQGSVFMNGSLKGADEYSLKQFGGGERPTQLLLTFDKTKERLTDVSFITPA